MLKKLLLIIPFLGFTNSYSQTNDIKRIEFRYSNSIIMPSEINIIIYPTAKAAMVEIKSSHKNTKTAITTQKYLELSEALLKISSKDIVQIIGMCLDGGSSEINFSNGFNTVRYSVDCLTENDETTVHRDFLKSVKIILEIANLKITDIE